MVNADAKALPAHLSSHALPPTASGTGRTAYPILPPTVAPETTIANWRKAGCDVARYDVTIDYERGAGRVATVVVVVHDGRGKTRMHTEDGDDE